MMVCDASEGRKDFGFMLGSVVGGASERGYNGMGRTSDLCIWGCLESLGHLEFEGRSFLYGAVEMLLNHRKARSLL